MTKQTRERNSSKLQLNDILDFYISPWVGGGWAFFHPGPIDIHDPKLSNLGHGIYWTKERRIAVQHIIHGVKARKAKTARKFFNGGLTNG